MADLPEKEPQRLSERGDHALSQLLASARAGGADERVGSRERIWKGLVNPPVPSRWSWRIPAATLACAAAALLFFLLRPAPLVSPLAAAEPFATLTLAAGEVQAAGAGASWSVAQVGERLAEGSRLRTASNGRAYARFAAAGALFKEGSRASLARDQASRVVQLEEGAVALAVRGGSGGLVVRAGAYTIDRPASELSGTVFQVKVGAEQVVEVLVHEGTAGVRGPSTELLLHAGESWSSRSGSGRLTIDERDLAAARALAGQSTGGSPAAEAALRISGPAGAQISIDGVALGTAPLAVLQPVGSHQVTADHHGLRLTGQALLGPSGTVFELDPPPEPALPALAPPAEQPLSLRPGEVDAAGPLQQKLKGPLPAAERDTARYDLARLLSRRGKHAEAVALYEKLAAGSGAWSEPSLYEVGRLKLRYLSDPGGSVAAFAEYRRRHPRGALGHEVALSSIEAQLANGAPGLALLELDAFLVTFSSSERIDDVRFVRATVRRDRGDCAGARQDYLLLLRSPRHGDDALYFAAYCEQQTGAAAEARRHLQEYLLKFPAGRHQREARAALGR